MIGEKRGRGIAAFDSGLAGGSQMSVLGLGGEEEEQVVGRGGVFKEGRACHKRSYGEEKRGALSTRDIKKKQSPRGTKH